MARLSRFEQQPRRQWYPVARSCELARQPQASTVLGRHFVIYRDLAGQPVAHLDRCPHRNVPLSEGRCLKDDTIECPYHGWRFRPDGQCTLIPSLTREPKKLHRVETFATCEQYGLVWLCPVAGVVPATRPHSISEVEDDSYSTLVRAVDFPAGLHAVVENALDVPHTAILHRGLFRGGERNRIQVRLKRYETWAEAEYIGEPPPTGLVARLLNWGGSERLRVDHWDRFILPNLLQVEYRLGQRTHLLISGFCNPISDDETRLFAVVCVKTPWPRFIEAMLLRIIEPFAMKLFAQDARILEAQSKNLARQEESFMSTEIDVLGGSITRLLVEAFENERREELSQGVSGAPALASPDDTPREVQEIELDA